MKYLIIHLFTMGKDPPLCGSSMCSGSKAHLSNSTCFFCFRFASRCKITFDLQKKRTNWDLWEDQFMGIWDLCIWTGSVVDKSVLQERSKDKEDADLQSTNNEMFSWENKTSEEKFLYPSPHINCLGIGDRGQGVVDGCLQENCRRREMSKSNEQFNVWRP